MNNILTLLSLHKFHCEHDFSIVQIEFATIYQPFRIVTYEAPSEHSEPSTKRKTVFPRRNAKNQPPASSRRPHRQRKSDVVFYERVRFANRIIVFCHILSTLSRRRNEMLNTSAWHGQASCAQPHNFMQQIAFLTTSAL
jgi:hypothetical protein